MASKACLDVGDGNPAEVCGQSTAERASGIALDDDETGALGAQHSGQQLADISDVKMRIVVTAAMQAEGRIFLQAMFRRIQRRMLPGEIESRHDPEGGESCRDGCNLDGFWPGTDDNAYATGQLSPWLGSARVAL